MKKIKECRGITLIALITTIIVLAILSTIGVYAGTEILKSARLTAFTTELKIAQVKVNEIYEKMKNESEKEYYLSLGDPIGSNEQAIKALEATGNSTDIENFKLFNLNLLKELGFDGVERELLINLEKRKIVSYEGFKYGDEVYYTIEDVPDSLYNVQYVGESGGEEPGEEEPGGEEGITASEIANAEDKSQYYGARVEGYECTNSAAVNAWKIFYADENNIYIIADDYIPTDYCPEGKSGGTVTRNPVQPRGASFDGVHNDYAGSSDITDKKIKALNNDYFTKGYTSTNANMKSVAYMLDTNAWSVFAGDKAEYAIGGPPVEMLMKSYSQKHGVDYRAQASSDTGYQISNNGGSTWANYISGLDTDDSLYVINSDLNANGMWLASPSAIDIDVVVYVNYYGDVGNDYYYSASDGFRPLVCLQSNVHLQKNADGSYTIK